MSKIEIYTKNSCIFCDRAKQVFKSKNLSFTEYNIFISNMDAMLETLLNTPSTSEADRVIYPGIMEYENEQDRIENGIPLHKEVVEWFSSTSKLMKIDSVKLL